MEAVKQYDIIRYVHDDHAELYINLNDLEKLIEQRKPRMIGVHPEAATLDKFIAMLRKYETAINHLP